MALPLAHFIKYIYMYNVHVGVLEQAALSCTYVYMYVVDSPTTPACIVHVTYP